MHNRYPMNSLMIAGLTGIIVLAGLAVVPASVAESRSPVLRCVMKEPVGLVVDNRANAYTADRETGRIYCLPADGAPLHFATVDGRPTTLAVDRHRTLYVGTASGLIHAVRQDGIVRVAYRCRDHVAGLDVDRDGGLLIATQEGMIIKVARSDFE